MRTLYHGVIVCVVSPRPHPPDTFAEGAEAVCAQPVGRGKDNGEQLREHGGARDCYEGLYCLGTNTALLTLCATQCCVLVANRELLDEELFVDHQYAVSFTAANSGKYP